MTQEPNMESPPLVDEASQPFVGRWNQLVSTTNWEKGRIIAEWREALVAAGAAVAEYADDAWASRVGGVTPQHVGRLRRVFQRFQASYSQYAGLFWSHFQAAVEWTDAEMWLEGAVQSDWSVAAMRRTRWETLGSDEALRPRDEEIVATEPDEDYVVAKDSAENETHDATERHSSGDASGPRHDGPDFGEEAEPTERSAADADEFHADNMSGDMSSERDGETTSPATVRPFANLAALPDDLAETFDALKLAILHHKTEGWTKVSCDDVLAALDALKTLAIAPSDKA